MENVLDSNHHITLWQRQHRMGLSFTDDWTARGIITNSSCFNVSILVPYDLSHFYQVR